jgi:hypothetical protein
MSDLYKEARAAVEASGFGNIRDTSPSCDLITNAARCAIFATKGDVTLELYVFDAGTDPDEVGVGVPGQATVRIVARASSGLGGP